MQQELIPEFETFAGHPYKSENQSTHENEICKVPESKYNTITMR